MNYRDIRTVEETGDVKHAKLFFEAGWQLLAVYSVSGDYEHAGSTMLFGWPSDEPPAYPEKPRASFGVS